MGCICQEGFEGAHCEINTNKKSLTVNDVVVKASNSSLAGLIVAGVVGGVLLITGFLYMRDRKQKKRRRKRRLEAAGIQTSDSFRANHNAEMA